MHGIRKYPVAVIILSFIIATTAIAETIKSPCTLVYDKRGRKVSHHFELGFVIKGRCEFKLMEFAGATAITANGVFMNTGDKAMGFAYYVSFFDKEGELIGSTGFAGWDEATALAPGKSARPASCLVRIPDSLRGEVVSYQVAFYEEERTAQGKARMSNQPVEATTAPPGS